MNSHKYDYLFGILLIGDSNAGKWEFLLKFTNDSFTSNHLITIGVDFRVKIIDYKNKLIKLQIWDTAAEERFRTIAKTYYKEKHGIILMYNVTDKYSFLNLRNWIKGIQYNNPSIKLVLVGNKCDEPNRVVSEEEGKKMAAEFNIGFFETSLKTNKNINEVFNYLVGEILKEKEGEKIDEKGCYIY